MVPCCIILCTVYLLLHFPSVFMLNYFTRCFSAAFPFYEDAALLECATRIRTPHVARHSSHFMCHVMHVSPLGVFLGAKLWLCGRCTPHVTLKTHSQPKSPKLYTSYLYHVPDIDLLQQPCFCSNFMTLFNTTVTVFL